jgi:FtsH-binding integral membrane protein
LLASLANIFFKSSGLSLAISVIGIFVFIGLTAYDTQKLKNMYYQIAGSADMLAKASIMGALNLYLDFINLFVMMLRFVGDRR